MILARHYRFTLADQQVISGDGVRTVPMGTLVSDQEEFPDHDAALRSLKADLETVHAGVGHKAPAGVCGKFPCLDIRRDMVSVIEGMTKQ